MENNQLNISKNPSNFRRVFCLSLFVILALSIHAQSKLKFVDTKKSFGLVKKGELVKLEYEFINDGNQPLVITEAKVECSCTSVDFPKNPIPPKQKGVVIITFDTKTVYDRQDRTVEIVSNAENSSQKIRFKGVVLK